MGTTNFNWNYIAKGKNPWATDSEAVLQAIDTELYGIKHGTTVLDDIKTKSPWVDVRAYGAKGDGVTDDTAAIQAAYNTLPYGGIVMIPPNFNCLITDTIHLPNSILSPGYKRSAWNLVGYGSMITYDGTGTAFELTPTNFADIDNVLRSHSFEGLSFKGPANRTSICIDLQSHSSSRIINCNFNWFGIGVRLVYSFWPLVQSCNFYDCYRTGLWCATGYGILPGGGSLGANMGAGHSIDTCHFYSQTATNVDIEGMTRGASCIVTWTNHGMETGDMVFFSAITQADWTALNKRRYTITKINSDSFSIPVNTSGYVGDYNAGVDAGQLCKHVSMMMLGPGQTVVNQCGFEGNSGIDNIYLYGEGGGTSSHRFTRIYHENVPVAKGSLICLDKDYSGYLTVDEMTHAQNDITIIDAYDTASFILDLNKFHIGGTGYKFRATRSTKAVNGTWDIKHFGLQNESVDLTDSIYWVDAVRPGDGYGYLLVERTYDGKHYKFPWDGMRFDSKLVNNACIVFGANDVTPGVSEGNFFKTANNVPTTITIFDYGVDGQSIKVLINDAVTTIQFRDAGHPAAHLRGNAGLDWTPTTGDWLEAVFDGTDWYCSVHDCTA